MERQPKIMQRSPVQGHKWPVPESQSETTARLQVMSVSSSIFILKGKWGWSNGKKNNAWFASRTLWVVSLLLPVQCSPAQSDASRATTKCVVSGIQFNMYKHHNLRCGIPWLGVILADHLCEEYWNSKARMGINLPNEMNVIPPKVCLQTL